ncbi:hypothetical protein SmJEL517_g04238 [Synchytrium microbalum]|uniref:AAA+ ATPase domain-containing protein n=1 Tax=Synchytrium microbalum TaxID=1806994 RepID=A0A507C441_9FUNG|nr:uncharacterized protein SmJEL517_g04238 [Synchytrium microbalum]TPX32736.1 hypothetical protein SmJEL517_g04238 [Synchytrium microbalum]
MRTRLSQLVIKPPFCWSRAFGDDAFQSQTTRGGSIPRPKQIYDRLSGNEPVVGLDGATVAQAYHRHHQQSHTQLHEDETHHKRSSGRTLVPKMIRSQLDEFVIGQDKLKKALSVAIFNHYIRIDNNLSSHSDHDGSELRTSESRSSFHGRPARRNNRKQSEDEGIVMEKSNILIIGPTGSGKTLIAKTTAQLLDVPFSMNEATGYTQSGYVGADVEECITRLLQNADFDVASAERGIVYIDEVDKIARRIDSNPNQRDVTGQGVQEGLLRMLEGTVVNVTVKPGQGKRNSAQGGEVYSVDTSNILFICSGAFVGLEKIVKDRTSSKGSIGFGAPLTSSESANDLETENILEGVEPEDLIKFGYIPEFVGRLPVVAAASQLTIDQLISVLTQPRNALVRQYEEIFKRAGMELRFHMSALRAIAELAVKKRTGARGLRRIMESVLQEALYEYPGTDVKYLLVDEQTISDPAHNMKTWTSIQSSEAQSSLLEAFQSPNSSRGSRGKIPSKPSTVPEIPLEGFDSTY